MKILEFFFFLSENVQFLEVKFSMYLNRRVFIMGYVAVIKEGIVINPCVSIVPKRYIAKQRRPDQGLHYLHLIPNFL